MTDVLGIDHIYISVSDMPRAERFYGRLMPLLGFRRNEFVIDGARHVQFYNRHFGYVLRPARVPATHDAYAPGLHHLCLRVDTVDDLAAVAKTLNAAGIEVGAPRRFPEYAPDYHAVFLADPDGIRLEITNYRAERRHRHDRWEDDPGA